MAELLRLAGYSAVALTIPTGLMKERTLALRRCFEGEGLETYLRIDLTSPSRRELLRLLRRFRNLFDVVAVKCVHPAVAPVACRDGRVDVVFFDPRNRNTRFNHSLANLLNGSLEFNLPATLHEPNSDVMLSLAREASIARQHGTSVVLSSGAFKPELIKSPIQMRAIAAAVGLSQKQTIAGVSEVPRNILARNMKRRSREYIEEGVKIVLAKAR